MEAALRAGLLVPALAFAACEPADLRDIYDRHTGLRIYEDIPLSEGSKVLGSDRYLYLLLNKDFPPWRIAKLRLRR